MVWHVDSITWSKCKDRGYKQNRGQVNWADQLCLHGNKQGLELPRCLHRENLYGWFQVLYLNSTDDKLQRLLCISLISTVKYSYLFFNAFVQCCTLISLRMSTSLLNSRIRDYWKECCFPHWLECHAAYSSLLMEQCCSPWGVNLCFVRPPVTFFCIIYYLQTLYCWHWAS